MRKDISTTMSVSAKIAMITWWIFLILSFFLWYRNNSLDRVMAPFFLAFGLICLFYYAKVSGASPTQSDKAIFITMWLQCLLLAVGTYIYLRSSELGTVISGVLVVIYLLIVVVALLYAVFGTVNLDDEWLFLAYFLAILCPLLILVCLCDYRLVFSLVYIVIVVAYLSITCDKFCVVEWSCLAVGLAFLVWLLGL